MDKKEIHFRNFQAWLFMEYLFEQENEGFTDYLDFQEYKATYKDFILQKYKERYETV